MIRHLFKMIWNQKRRNFGLILEIFFSFMVLFAVLTFIINKYTFYVEPLGFDYKDIWVVKLGQPQYDVDGMREANEQFAQLIKSYPEVESFSASQSNIPYGTSRMMTSFELGDKSISVDVFRAFPELQPTLDIELLEGRWFTKEDKINNPDAIIINSQLAKAAFGEESAIGKTLENYKEKPLKILGVVNNYKYEGEFTPAEPSFFGQVEDSTDYNNILLLEVKPGTAAAFEEKLLTDLNRLTSGWSFDISYMDEMRARKLRAARLPMIIFLIISGFLIFNVALGLFGVLWYNISKRKQEIGVRRAMGASKRGIGWQFVGEVIVLTLLSLSLGVFFAVQLPLLKVFDIAFSVYLGAIISSILLIGILVLICSIYPSRQAAQLQPALALHNE